MEVANGNTEQKQPTLNVVVDEVFHAYLKSVEVDVARIPPYQIENMKRAFYGGMSAHIVIANKIANMEFEKAKEILNGVDGQVNEFWKSRGFVK